MSRSKRKMNKKKSHTKDYKVPRHGGFTNQSYLWAWVKYCNRMIRKLNLREEVILYG